MSHTSSQKEGKLTVVQASSSTSFGQGISILDGIYFVIILFEFFLIWVSSHYFYIKRTCDSFSLNISGLDDFFEDCESGLVDPQHSICFLLMSKLFYVIFLSEPIFTYALELTFVRIGLIIMKSYPLSRVDYSSSTFSIC